jgi:hypothetical protein
MSCDLVTASHLGRKAVVYIRQSSPHQVLTRAIAFGGLGCVVG